MKSCYIGFLFLIINYFSVYPQNVNDLYSRVENKLRFDKTYLNVYYLMLQPEGADLQKLSNIPRTDGKEPFSFEIKEGIEYVFYFLHKSPEFDSVALLYVHQIENKSVSTESFFGEGGSGSQIDTTFALRFKDVQELYFNNYDKYKAIVDFIDKSLNDFEPGWLFAINIDDEVHKSKGISNVDNKDFLNFLRVNGSHRYPKDITQSPQRQRRRGQQETSSSGGSEFLVFGSFSSVNFFHSSMDFGFSSVSAEINLGNNVLNLLPWESMSLSAGIRAFVTVSGDAQNVNDDFLIDAKIMGRTSLNFSNFVGSLPFLAASKPRLHITPGVIIDLKTTRIFGLPFINLYFATGSKDFDKPYVVLTDNIETFSYFTTTQWEASMSFFWNSNEKMNLRFKMDLGAGQYDVTRAAYTPVFSTAQIYNQVQPMMAFYFNFVPEGNELFGSQFRFFDSRLTLSFWMKILEFAPDHLFRFETKYITTPFFRNNHPWEVDNSSSIIQIKYRYGF